MPEYLAPGLFIEEIDTGSKPIEGVGTNTAAFIGYAKSGEFNKPTFITNWSQFVAQFGEEENALTTALCKELNMTVSTVRAAKKASRKGWTDFAMTTFKKASDAGKTPSKTWQEFVKTHQIPTDNMPYIEGAYLAHAVKGYYDNGGGRAYIVRVARPEDMTALKFSANGAESDSKGTPATPARIAAGPLLITAKTAGAAGNDIRVEVEHSDKDKDDFKLKIIKDEATELFPAKDTDPPLKLDAAIKAVNQHSKFVAMERVATATATRPDARMFILQSGSEPVVVSGAKTPAGASSGSPLTNGLATLRENEFIGDEATRSGAGGLAPVEDVNFICAPDLMAGLFQREKVDGTDIVGPEFLTLDDARRQAILDMQCQLVSYCESNPYRMAILDPLPGLNPLEMKQTTNGTPYNCDKGQAAIYYPWVSIPDPLHKGHQMMCPPSGHIAGVWARVGSERGVHKAPANETLMGVVGLEYDLTRGEQEILNPDGINCIRAFSGRGIRVWGARTLATVGNPSWKYVNVRRLFNYLEQSMENNLQWTVFEPNDPDLWGRVRRTISAFLYVAWRDGMLFGNSPSEAFFVKCDADTNPQETIDLGRLYCEVGINPVKPAEFVIVRMGQWSGGGSMTEQNA